MQILTQPEPRIVNGILQEFVNTNILMTKTEKQMLVLSGGACRSFVTGENPNDFDLFIIGIDAANEVKFDVIRDLDEAYERIFTCPEGLLHSWKAPYGKIQLITPQVYKTVHHLFQSFDFTVCQAAFGQSAMFGSKLMYTKEFWDDTTKKELQLLNVSYPMATMNRIFKYRYKHGYKTAAAEKEFLAQVYEREFADEPLYRRYID